MSDWIKEKYLLNFLYFGFFVLFCAPWFLTSNTPYHKLIIIFIWLPALLHLVLYYANYASFDRMGACLYFIAAGWYSLVVVCHAQNLDDIRELKIPFYVGLTLLGLFAIAQADSEKFKRFLLFCAVVGGFGAWSSWIYFYLIEGNPLLSRHPAIGLWSVIIPAAQAVGALVIVLATLGLKTMTRPLVSHACIVSLAGYGVFLISNQSRGVWVALIIALVVAALLSRSRMAYWVIALFSIALIALFFVEESVFLKRGESFRLELWEQGLHLALKNWMLGLGFDKFQLIIDSTETVFSHPHNMFLDIAVRFGILGLISWLLLWGWAISRAFHYRSNDLGRVALVLLIYSSVVVMTDGIAQWMKPNPGWFVTWLPLALAFTLGSGKQQAKPDVISVLR